MMAGAACLCLTSCGNSNAKEGATSVAEPVEYGYQAEFYDLDAMEGAIQHATLVGDTCFFTASGDAGGEGAGQKLYRLEDGKPVEVKLQDWKETQSVAALGAVSGDKLKLAVLDYEEPIKYELRTVTADGATVDSVDITSCFSEEPEQGISGMAADGEGNIYVINGMGLKVIDGKGEQLFAVTDIRPIDIECSLDGQAVLALQDRMGPQLRRIDLQSKSLGEAYTNLGNLQWTVGLAGGSKDAPLYYSGETLYTYSPETGGTELLSFMDYDLNSNDIKGVLRKENGDFIVLTTRINYDFETPKPEKSQAVAIRQVDASSLPQKTEIVFATSMLDSELKEKIIAFNRASYTYRIKVKDYFGEGYDFDEARSQLSMDIIAGKGPDFVDIKSIGNEDLFISKNLLEDLTPWMEQDEEIGKEKYLDNILNVYKRNGKLYGLISSFNIRGMVAKKSVAGEKEFFTLDDLMKLAENKGDESSLFGPDMTKFSLMIQVCLPPVLNQFVDWETGECSFDSEEFIRIMEFVNTYGVDEIPQNHDYNQTAVNLQSGKQLLSAVWLANVYDYVMYREVFQEDISFIGYPVNSGCGFRIMPTRTFAMISTADDKKKEGAWQFIRTFLLKDYQDNIGVIYGFPVMESALEGDYQEAMTPEYTVDENGNQVEAPKFSSIFSSMAIDIYSLTQEDVDGLNSLIRKVDKLYQFDEQIGNIVMEEAESYFAGAKTAQEAADIIQSRIHLYVNENR